MICDAKYLSPRPILTCLVLATVVSATVITVPASAAQPTSIKSSANGITISPPLKEITIGSGLLKANANITLTNRTGKNLNANIRVVDFSALGEFGAVSLNQEGDAKSKYGLANWMRVPAGNSIQLPNGKVTEVPIEINNGNDLRPGGHYGALVVTASAPTDNGSNKVSFRQELVSLFFVKKVGGEQYGLQLSSFNVDKKSDIPDTATLKFKSTGNVHVVPRGYVAVTDPRGKLVAKGTINTESTLIMPGTARQLITLLQPVANSSEVGRYKVTAHYRYDGEDSFTTKTIYINRFKLPLALIAIVAITGVVLLLALLKLRKNKHFKNTTK